MKKHVHYCVSELTGNKVEHEIGSYDLTEKCPHCNQKYSDGILEHIYEYLIEEK